MPLESAAQEPVAASYVAPLDLIRSRTRALHLELEAAFDLRGALGSLHSYRLLLRRYLSVFDPFEQELARQPASTLRLISYRSRRSLLERDLRVLGDPLLEPLPPSPALPRLDDLDAVFGVLYVVEGSSLGGQIIFRQIQGDLHLDADTGAAFFFGDGNDTSRTWKHFTATLNANVQDASRAADAAAKTFAAFYGALVPPPSGAGA